MFFTVFFTLRFHQPMFILLLLGSGGHDWPRLSEVDLKICTAQHQASHCKCECWSMALWLQSPSMCILLIAGWVRNAFLDCLTKVHHQFHDVSYIIHYSYVPCPSFSNDCTCMISYVMKAVLKFWSSLERKCGKTSGQLHRTSPRI